MQLGAMPPANYLLVHPEARVTQAQLDTLKHYLHPSDAITPATAEAIAATDAQYQKWIASGSGTAPAANVAPELNGLAFLPDYKQWKPVSTTERFDNGTMRVILGNDVAQKAIAADSVRPWPDGSAFAKVTFRQQPDSNGTIWTGGVRPSGAHAQGRAKVQGRPRAGASGAGAARTSSPTARPRISPSSARAATGRWRPMTTSTPRRSTTRPATPSTPPPRCPATCPTHRWNGA